MKRCFIYRFDQAKRDTEKDEKSKSPGNFYCIIYFKGPGSRNIFD
jgi:hypothetical protein